MRCTNCNKEIKPVVAIDIDGTLGMYHRHFLDFARGYLDKPQATPFYHGDQPFKKWFCQVYDATEDQWHDIKLAYRQGGMKRTMPPYPYASDLMQHLYKADLEVWVTTTRPYIRHDNVDPDTREWLRRNDIPYDYLIYDGAKYEKLANLVGRERVAAVLEDLPEEVDNASRLFGLGIAIHRRNNFNSTTDYFNQVSNLVEAENRIDIQVRAWRDEYEDGRETRRTVGHRQA